MWEKIKSIRLNVTLMAVLCVILGIVFIIWPEESVNVIARLVAVILIIAGIVMFIGKLLSEENRASGMLIGALIAAIGIWMFARPQVAASLIPIAIGVILIVNGIQGLTMAAAGSKANASRVWGMILMAVIDLIAGVLTVLYAFGIVKLSMVVLGIMLVYDGISSMVVVGKVNHAEKTVVDSKILREQDIDDLV